MFPNLRNEGFQSHRCEGNMFMQIHPPARLCGRSDNSDQGIPLLASRVSFHSSAGTWIGYASELEALSLAVAGILG